MHAGPGFPRVHKHTKMESMKLQPAQQQTQHRDREPTAVAEGCAHLIHECAGGYQHVHHHGQSHVCCTMSTLEHPATHSEAGIWAYEHLGTWHDLELPFIKVANPQMEVLPRVQCSQIKQRSQSIACQVP